MPGIKLEYTPWRGYAGPHISLTVHAGSVVGPSIRVRQRSAGAYEVMVGPGASTASAFGKEELLESLVDWVADQVGSERAARAVREASPRGALWRVTLRTVALLAAVGLLLTVAFCGP